MYIPVITEPNKILHTMGREVTPEEMRSKEMKKFIKDMIETMYIKDGVGIAAHQVANPIKVCIIAKQFSPINKREDLVLANPVWEKMTTKTIWDQEGCLSVPRVYGEIKRYTHIRVKALDKNGEPIEFEVKDFPACIVQHETDHLNGHLYIEKAKNLHEVEKAI